MGTDKHEICCFFSVQCNKSHNFYTVSFASLIPKVPHITVYWYYFKRVESEVWHLAIQRLDLTHLRQFTWQNVTTIPLFTQNISDTIKYSTLRLQTSRYDVCVVLWGGRRRRAEQWIVNVKTLDLTEVILPAPPLLRVIWSNIFPTPPLSHLPGQHLHQAATCLASRGHLYHCIMLLHYTNLEIYRQCW